MTKKHDPLQQAAQQIRQFKAGLAGDVEQIFSDTKLVCKLCGFMRKLEPGEAAYFTFHGWPKHCDKTMSLAHTEAPRNDDNSISGIRMTFCYYWASPRRFVR